jgi:hypothetical protein
MHFEHQFGDRMRLFCELVDAGHSGTEERWTHAAETWTNLREEARMSSPHSLTGELRQQYLAMRAELEATKRAEASRTAEEEARAAERAAGWPRKA